MTVYGRSDITFVSISGVDHTHEKKKSDTLMTVSCVACEPQLMEMGWATNPRHVEMTFDEIHELEDAQHEIARFESLKVAENAREAAAAVRSAGNSVRRGPTR